MAGANCPVSTLSVALRATNAHEHIMLPTSYIDPELTRHGQTIRFDVDSRVETHQGEEGATIAGDKDEQKQANPIIFSHTGSGCSSWVDTQVHSEFSRLSRICYP